MTVYTLAHALFCGSLFYTAYSLDVAVWQVGKQVGPGETSFANFAKHPFHHLDVNPIASRSVTKSSQCAFVCVETVNCFSFNVAVQSNEGTILCELLPTDKYNASDKFKASRLYHHHSIFTPCSAYPCKNGGTCVPLYSVGDFNCTCPRELYGTVHLKIRSTGYDDPTFTKNSIIVNGIDYSPHKRGHNIVSLNPDASVHSTAFFDTHDDPTSGVKMRDYINSLPNGKIVLAATQDTGNSYYQDAQEAFEGIGAEKNLSLGYRSSWYLAGYKGQPKPTWITQGYAAAGEGPLEVEMNILVQA